jgi:hypothetical protein
MSIKDLKYVKPGWYDPRINEVHTHPITELGQIYEDKLGNRYIYLQVSNTTGHVVDDIFYTFDTNSSTHCHPTTDLDDRFELMSLYPGKAMRIDACVCFKMIQPVFNQGGGGPIGGVIKTIEDVQPNTAGNFGLGVGSNMTLTKGTNGITLNAKDVTRVISLNSWANRSVSIVADGTGINVRDGDGDGTIYIKNTAPVGIVSINNEKAEPSTNNMQFTNGDSNINIGSGGVGSHIITVSAPGMVKSLGGVSANDSGAIGLEAGTNVTLSKDTTNNKITISATGGVTDVGVKTINNTTPATNGNFSIGAGTNVAISPATNGINISAFADGVKTITDISPDPSGNIDIVGGNNVDVETSGNTITISATGGGTSGVSSVNLITGAVEIKSTDSSVNVSVTADKKLDLKNNGVTKTNTMVGDVNIVSGNTSVDVFNDKNNNQIDVRGIRYTDLSLLQMAFEGCQYSGKTFSVFALGNEVILIPFYEHLHFSGAYNRTAGYLAGPSIITINWAYTNNNQLFAVGESFSVDLFLSTAKQTGNTGIYYTVKFERTGDEANGYALKTSYSNVGTETKLQNLPSNGNKAYFTPYTYDVNDFFVDKFTTAHFEIVGARITPSVAAATSNYIALTLLGSIHFVNRYYTTVPTVH